MRECAVTHLQTKHHTYWQKAHFKSGLPGKMEYGSHVNYSLLHQSDDAKKKLEKIVPRLGILICIFFWFALVMKHMLSGGKKTMRQGQSTMGHIHTHYSFVYKGIFVES